MPNYRWEIYRDNKLPPNTVAWSAWSTNGYRSAEDQAMESLRSMASCGPVRECGPTGRVWFTSGETTMLCTPAEFTLSGTYGRYPIGYALVEVKNSGCPCGICQGEI